MHLLLQTNAVIPKKHKDRFAIRTASEIYFLKTDDIVYFQANAGVIFAFDKFNKKHMMPQTTLKEIETVLNPENFFRINRSESIQKKYVDKIKRYDKNTLTVYLNQSHTLLKTSQNKTSEFNMWLDV